MNKILLLPLLLLLHACTVQTIFDNLGPKDRESRVANRNISFGPLSEQALDIYVPLESTGKDPVLMFIYGGSWKNGDKDGYDFVGRAFAARGFITVIADYRKVPEVVFPTFVEDGALAVKWISENITDWNGDPSRIYLVGHSAGAYNAVMLGLDPQYLATVGLDSDTVDGVAGIAGPYDFFPYDVAATIDAFGHIQDPDITQPINLATPDAPPMLLVMGTDDTVVFPRNIPALEKALQENSIRVETRLYEGLDHIEPVTALSVTFRKKAPVLDDITGFFINIDETMTK
ncbi:alpha/beta hydrolase [Parvularcula sp. IMCC14364]|uniref:alpha/beta hydrolase n=1 Tax=Parvularcula sp. IMCC14364 TaxID=3067902 RepID=UPI0027426A7D|nr:alpha/beta hydrolase [Parvularcula sp. IMCC14364]